MSKQQVSKALNHAHWQWNGLAFNSAGTVKLDDICARISERHILHIDGNIVVTNVGFVTMAIHIDYARYANACIIAPGVDHAGKRGYLVLRESGAPYHSQADSIAEALKEALQSRQKACALIDQFHGKRQMLRSVRKAPWHLWINRQDFQHSGVCWWGTQAFLRRIGLYRFATKFGLPRCALHNTGTYGDLLIASALLRQQTASDDALQLDTLEKHH